MFPASMRVLGWTAATWLLFGSDVYGQQTPIEDTDFDVPAIELGEIVVFNPEGRDIRCFSVNVADQLVCQLVEQREAIQQYHDMLSLQREIIRLVKCLGESESPTDCVSPPSYKIIPPVPGDALLSEIKGLDDAARKAAKSALLDQIEEERAAKIEYVDRFF